tara:strand:+ start:1778 stop:5152 length:3375 start_codon:yes stop_codon:yes gene_type:complete
LTNKTGFPITILITAVLGNLLFGQSDFSFKNISVQDGLSESSVNVIYEDKDGFLYFGTENGLDVYNGYEFQNYHMNSFDTLSLLGNKVSSLYEDSNHMFWVGTELGISRFNPVNRSFSRPVDLKVSSNGDVEPETIVEDSNGDLWIKLLKDGSLYKYAPNNGDTECMNCDSSQVLYGRSIGNIYKSVKDILWFGTDNGLFFLNSKNKIELYSLSSSDLGLVVTAIEQGEGNVLWVGTTEGLYALTINVDSSSNIFTHKEGANSLVSNNINDLDWNDTKKELWIATKNGVSRYVPKDKKFYNIQTTPFADSIIENDVSLVLSAERSGQLWFTTNNIKGLNCLSVAIDPYSGELDTVFTHFDHDPIDPTSIADNEISGFIEDLAGNIWIGTGQNGISFNSFVKPKFFSYRYDQENEWGLKSDKIYSITTQSDGMMWVATGYGLEFLSSDCIREYDYEKSILDINYVMDLEIVNDEYLWVASDKGVLRVNTMTDEVVRFSTSDSLPKERRISDDLIYDILVSDDGALWVATASGMVIIDTLNLSTVSFDSDLIARVLMQDNIGNIWLGTEMDGIYMLSAEILDDVKKGKDFELEGYVFDPEFVNGISSSQITSITEGLDGSIWIGTNGGLNKYQSKADDFIHYFVEDGLPSNYITAISVDDNNDLWISSKKGITFYDQSDSVFTNYGLTDGIGNIDFHRNSYARSEDGNLYFGGPKGITKVNPKNLQYNDYQPPCVITRLKKISKDDVVSEQYALASFLVDADEKSQPTAVIKHWVKSFTIDFVSLNYHKTVKNQYRYKLEPFDKGWVESGGLRFASYNNLGRGSYSFKVQGSNDDGLWSKTESLDVIFVPHPLLSYWAFGVYTIFTLVGVFVFVRFRMQKQKNELEEERRVKEMEQAREFQMSLIPQSPPDHPDYDIALHMKTSTEVGGDYYDFFPQEDGSMYVVCGDATGHGLNAGMMVSITKAGLYGSTFDTPATTTTRLNQTIKAIDLGTTRMSLNMAKFHNGSFDFTSAGMPPAYLYKEETGKVDEILIPGLPLGSMKKADFDLQSFSLESNDVLVLISDGLPECVNHEGEMLDYEPIRECIQLNGEKSADGIINSLIDLGDDWMSGLMNDDDITLVVIKKR